MLLDDRTETDANMRKVSWSAVSASSVKLISKCPGLAHNNARPVLGPEVAGQIAER
jgi:hypothetical protein